MITTVPSPPVPVTLLVISAAIIVLGIIVYLGRRPWREKIKIIEKLSASDILRVNATVLAGVLIFVTIASATSAKTLIPAI